MLLQMTVCWLLLSFPSLTRADTLLVFGDSLSAGYGLKEKEDWVSLISRRLAKRYPEYQIVNASLSGETTRGGLARLPKALTLFKPSLVLLALGANDGLRGLSIKQMNANLQSIIQKTKASGSDVILLEMRIPPNYGKRYTDWFEKSFQATADKANIRLIPFFMQGIAENKTYFLPDNLHPNAKAQPILMEAVWEHIEPWLKSQRQSRQAPAHQPNDT